MDTERVIQVRAAIAARAGGGAPSVADVCLACARLTGACGVTVSLAGAVAVYEPVYGTDPRAETLAELQVTLGEGPGVEAVRQDRAVLIPAIDAVGVQRRWPLFAPQAVELGVGAAMAFPLLIGAIAIGVLEAYWTQSMPAGEPIADGMLFADAALIPAALLRLRHEPGNNHAGTASDEIGWPGTDGLMDRWPEVHQATGIVSVQLESGLTEAFARLRAYSYGHELPLREVARRVVAHTLRFAPDGEDPTDDPGRGR